MDYVFRNVKIVKIVGSMNFVVVISEVQACVFRLVLELDVIMIKIAHHVNIVLERIRKCVPERTLRKRVNYTNGDCSTGHCSDNDRKCASGACDSKKESKSENKNITIWLLVVGIVIPFTVVIVSLCIICCSRKRKASEKSRESINQRHENIQIPNRRTT